jgi:zinc transporter 1/2/3
MAGLIAMVSVFFVVSIEMFFSTMNGGPTGGCHGGPGMAGGYETLTPTTSTFGHRRGNSAASMASFMGGQANPVSISTRPAVRTRRSGSIGHQLQRIEMTADGMEPSDTEDLRGSDEYIKSDEDSDVGEDTELQALNTRKRSNSSSRVIRRQHLGGRLTDEQQQKKNLLQVMLLEAGILFHSVFIGAHKDSSCGLVRLANVLN